MKVMYAGSERTNPKRLAACHSNNGQGKPLRRVRAHLQTCMDLNVLEEKPEKSRIENND